MKKTMNDAKKIILDMAKEKNYELITLEEAEERVLFEDVKAKFNIPESNKSAVDGYAFNIDNLIFPAKLKITDEAKAGENPKKYKGGAVFIMTGAVVPKGANTVVRIEDTEKEGNYIIVKSAEKGDLINPTGDEIKKDETVLKKGTFLDYKKVALLANLGVYHIKVYQKVKIGIIVTGDEVKEVYEELGSAGVKNTNFYILKGILRKYADITYYGIVKDEPEKLKDVFLRALSEEDILLSSGGASKGKYDFTKKVARKIGLDIHFTATNIRPGRPLIFANKDKKLFFGLPGYPSALLVNAITFLLPAVRKMVGLKEIKTFKAIAKEELKSRKGRVDFVRVKAEFQNGKIYVKNAGSQQTSIFTSMAVSDYLAVIDETKDTVRSGEIVEIIRND